MSGLICDDMPAVKLLLADLEAKSAILTYAADTSACHGSVCWGMVS